MTAALLEAPATAVTPSLKVTVESSVMAKALTALKSVLYSRSTVPILSAVKVEPWADLLELTVTNLETTITIGIPYEGLAEGKAAIPLAALLNFAKASKGSITIEVTETRVKLSDGRASASIDGYPADEFPPTVEYKDGFFSAAVETAPFLNTAAIVAASAADESARGAVLQGTLLRVRDGDIQLISTDGYRLAQFNVLESVVTAGDDEQIILPCGFMASLAKVKPFVEQDGFLSGFSSQVRFQSGPVTVTSRAVDGTYPNSDQVIPRDYDRSFTSESDDLLDALKRAIPFLQDRAYSINLTFRQGGVHLASTVEGADFKFDVPGLYTGEECSIRFNAQYLAQCIKPFKGQGVRLELLGPLSPMKISGAGGQNFTILMPLRK